MPHPHTEVNAVFEELDRRPALGAYAAALRQLKPHAEAFSSLRVAVLVNHTFDITATLTVECARRGFWPTFLMTGYDQYRQELLDPDSSLARFAPDAVILSLAADTLFPAGVFPSGTDEERLNVHEWAAGLGRLLSNWRERDSAPVIVVGFPPPAVTMEGLLAASLPHTAAGWIDELNAAVRAEAQRIQGVYLLDYSLWSANLPLAEARDWRLWYLARAGLNPKHFPALAGWLARMLAAARRAPAKCLVLDLDDTVWGGILGDEGPAGIQCAGGDYPGNAYAAFQRAVLALRSRGILLAVASKNDAALVAEAFQVRSDMPLRPEHIAHWETHWEPKVISLERIARTLNIGLDSLVFLDDNPAEIDLIRQTLPSVRAYRLPPRPEEYTGFLARLEDFDQLTLSAEDRRRAELYIQRQRQQEMMAGAVDLESFYLSLGTVVQPQRANPHNRSRIVQLIQKTNQFNLTTRRHTDAALVLREASGAELWGYSARDQHTDHGLIAVALLEFTESGECLIESLLMSCRVIGRKLETAILHHIAVRARERGAVSLRGVYLPTAKNGLCQTYYQDHGFVPGGTEEWTLSIAGALPDSPAWITLENPT